MRQLRPPARPAGLSGMPRSVLRARSMMTRTTARRSIGGLGYHPGKTGLAKMLEELTRFLQLAGKPNTGDLLSSELVGTKTARALNPQSWNRQIHLEPAPCTVEWWIAAYESSRDRAK